jgi:hypothetical protein
MYRQEDAKTAAEWTSRKTDKGGKKRGHRSWRQKKKKD